MLSLSLSLLFWMVPMAPSAFLPRMYPPTKYPTHDEGYPQCRDHPINTLITSYVRNGKQKNVYYTDTLSETKKSNCLRIILTGHTQITYFAQFFPAKAGVRGGFFPSDDPAGRKTKRNNPKKGANQLERRLRNEKSTQTEKGGTGPSGAATTTKKEKKLADSQ